MRNVILGFVAAHLIYGLLGGLAMKAVIPALNGFGVAWFALTYPFGFACIAAGDVEGERCSNVPDPEKAQWMFTFPAQRELEGM